MTNPYDPHQSGPQNFPQSMPPPPAPGPPQPVYGYAPMMPRRETNSMAVASLVLSLCGILCYFPAIGGVITGHIARKQIKQDPQRYEGEGLALAGLIVGWILTGLMLVGLLFYILVIVVAVGAGVSTY